MFGNKQKVETNMSRQTKDLIYVKITGLPDLLTTSEHPFYCKKVIKRRHNTPVYGEPKWVEAGALKKADKVALFVPPFGSVSFDKNLAFLLGYYVAEGWKTDSKRAAHPYRYYLCSSFEKREWLSNLLSKARIGYKAYDNRTVSEFHIHVKGKKNEILTSLFEKCGRYSETKRVPAEVWTWDKESINSFLDGYFAGDGYIEKKDDYSVMRYTSVSKELILEVAELVRMCFHKNVSIVKRSPNNNTIEGREVTSKSSYEGRFYLAEEKRKYYEYDEDNHILWVNVGETKSKVPSEETVYNLTVANTHSYIVNGVLVHNCSAYNYQVFGTANKRATFICEMHKARALANAYYWNSYYRKNNLPYQFHIFVPREWAEPIIGKEEYEMLLKLAEQNG